MDTIKMFTRINAVYAVVSGFRHIADPALSIDFT